MTPHGSLAEYAIGKVHAIFHLPRHIPFETAATVPLAAATAALALFARLGLPEPSRGNRDLADKPRGGVLVYGAASAVGSFAIKLLKKANIHLIIAIAGRGMDHAKSLISQEKGDVVIDYRSNESAIVRAIVNTIPAGESLLHAVDAVSEQSSFQVMGKVLDQTSGAASIVTPECPKELPSTIRVEFSNVGRIHVNHKHFGFVWSRMASRGLSGGWLQTTNQASGFNAAPRVLSDIYRSVIQSAILYKPPWEPLASLVSIHVVICTPSLYFARLCNHQLLLFSPITRSSYFVLIVKYFPNLLQGFALRLGKE